MRHLGNIHEIRANQMIQGKAQFEGNGWSFSRAVTPPWIIWLAPFGRAGKRLSAALRLLARTWPLPARRALRPTASQLAECTNIAQVAH